MAITSDELQSAIWNDERNMPPSTREVALALAWVLQAEHGASGRAWTRVKQLLGHSGPPYARWRLHELVAGDAPRYDEGTWYGLGGTCEGPRMRPYRSRDGYPDPDRDARVCGAHGTIYIEERDMTTGWLTARWFCARHRHRAAEVRAMLSARGEPPEPIPNSGGLLPRYFGGDWPLIYGRHCEIAGRHWAVPYHGVNADDWPVPGKTLIPKRPRLSLVAP